MNINLQLRITALSVASLLTFSALSAQNASRSYRKSFGNSYLGGEVYAKAQASHASGTNGRTELYGYAYAKLFKSRKHVMTAKALTQTGAGQNAHVLIRVAGKTIVSKTGPTSRSGRYQKMFDLLPRDLRVAIPIWGPVVLSAKGNVGAAFEAEVASTVTNSSAQSKGLARSSGVARGGLAVGVPGFKAAGVDVIGNIGAQSLTGDVTSLPSQRRLLGRATHVLQALRIKIKAWLRVPFPTCGKVWKKKCWRIRKTLAKFGSNKQTNVLVKF